MYEPEVRRLVKTRSGCSECKRKKVKCDEGKPACKRCTRYPEKCSYALRLSWTEGRPYKNPRKRMTTQNTFPVDPPFDLNPSENDKHDTVAFSVPASASLAASFLESQLHELQNERQELEVVKRFATNAIGHGEKPLHWVAAEACTLRSSAMNAPLTLFLAEPKARYFLHHYITNTSSVIFPLAFPGNPFRDVLIPRSLDTPYLLHAVLASACSHHARLCTDSETQRRSQQLSCYFTNSCLAAFREEIGKGAQGKMVEIISTALMLSMTDIISGDMTTWRAHLAGTRQLISKWVGNPSKELCIRDPTQLFLLKWFASFDSYGASGAFASTVPDGIYWSCDKTLDPQRGYIDEFTGYSHELFPILHRISQLQSVHEMKESLMVGSWTESSASSSTKEKQADAAYDRESSSLEDCLVELIHRDVTPEFKRHATPAQVSDLRLTHQLFVQVGLLRLYCHVQGHARTSSKALNALDASFEILERLPTKSPANILILWAVFHLGYMVEDPIRRNLLAERLDTMNVHGMGNVLRARDILSDHWELGTVDNHASIPSQSVQNLILF